MSVWATDDSPLYGPDRYSDAALRLMCDQGVRRLSERKTTLGFHLFNRHEEEVVSEYMRRAHPAVPFVIQSRTC